MGSKENKEKTKRVRKVSVDKKATKGKKNKFKYKHPRIATGIKIGIIVLILLAIIGGGVLVGTFFGIFGDELKISEEDLVIKFQNSTVYDKDGVELATLSGGTKRKIVSTEEMSEYLPKAYVAIEDERFYTHNGVDLKRTAAATATFLTHAGNSSFGGSSITQQLVKNITTDDEDSGLSGVLRKVKEMAKAIQVEQYLSKDQILELYLNIIFVGGDDINGVALGSIYYFDKDVKDLTIAECAYLAGINHSPNAYKPFSEDSDGKMKAKIDKRVNTVLGKMNELGYITKEQYDEAKKQVEDGLQFKKGDGANVTTTISYHTEAAIDQILEQLQEEKGYSKELAELYLYSSGLKIYTTQDSTIQARLEEELVKPAYYTSQKYKDTKTKETLPENSMPTMVIVDHHTGEVVACATAVGEKDKRDTSTKLGYMNWPTRLRKQTGSSMKPISVIAPGLATGVITPSTIYVDCPTKFADGSSFKEYYEGWKGPMSIRHAIGISANIPHVKALSNIGLKTSMEYCAKMGIDNLSDEGLSLALGGLGIGTSPMHMAMAYATIANDGTYISPTFYTKVTDDKGTVVLEPNQTTEEVLTEAQAYVEKSILTEPVVGSGGTASYCAVKGIATACKTGTTNDDNDRWLCGFTPYYTAACWYGYEHSATVHYTGNPAGKIWAAVMKDIHKELPNATFEKPEKGVVTASICAATGKIAVEGCTSVYQEVFVEGTTPGNCDGHVNLPICVETGLIAGPACPTEIRNFIALPEKEEGAKWNSDYAAWFNVPTDSCNVHIGGGAPAGPAGPAAPAPAPSTPTKPSTGTGTGTGGTTGEGTTGTGSSSGTGSSTTGGTTSGSGDSGSGSGAPAGGGDAGGGAGAPAGGGDSGSGSGAPAGGGDAGGGAGAPSGGGDAGGGAPAAGGGDA